MNKTSKAGDLPVDHAFTAPMGSPPAGGADIAALLAQVVPTARQVSWQSHELYAFIHFGMNTMTDREWGSGHEDPGFFDPRDLDVDQWMSSLVDARMTGVILTAKHHDGFCLWPSAYTEHSVKNSPWRNGRGDLVAEVAEAARRHGLDLGIYLSPWDRTEATYGSGRAYDDYFVAQLTELLTQYGDVFSVWFDGANGEGPNGNVQEYDWDRYYEVIRELQPHAAISVCGPDVRWCGNEAGHTRDDEWSVVPGSLRDVERIAERSQQVDDGEFAALVRSDEGDLGSRGALAGRLDDVVWYPAEVNTSIRPGWFYHATEDSSVKRADELFDLWCSAVGGNATLLLNVPPSPRGLIADPDVHELQKLGGLIDAFVAGAVRAAPTVSSGEWRAPADQVVPPGVSDPFARGWTDSSWTPDASDPEPFIRLVFDEPTEIAAVVVREDIRYGQNVEEFSVSVSASGKESLVARAGTVGYQRILRFDAVTADAVTVKIHAQRGKPRIRAVAAVAKGGGNVAS